MVAVANPVEGRYDQQRTGGVMTVLDYEKQEKADISNHIKSLMVSIDVYIYIYISHTIVYPLNRSR